MDKDLKDYIDYISAKKGCGYITDTDLNLLWQRNADDFDDFIERNNLRFFPRLRRSVFVLLNGNSYLEIIPLHFRDHIIGFYFCINNIYGEFAAENKDLDSALFEKYNGGLSSMTSFHTGMLHDSSQVSAHKPFFDPSDSEDILPYQNDEIDIILKIVSQNNNFHICDLSEQLGFFSDLIYMLSDNGKRFQYVSEINRGLFADINNFSFEFALINILILIFKNSHTEKIILRLKAFAEKKKIIIEFTSDSAGCVNDDSTEIKILNSFAEFNNSHFHLNRNESGGICVQLSIMTRLPTERSCLRSMKDNRDSIELSSGNLDMLKKHFGNFDTETFLKQYRWLMADKFSKSAGE